MGSMGSMASMGSIPVEHPTEQPGIMNSIMASVGIGGAVADPMASMASTIDQNSSRFERRPSMNPMGSMCSTIAEERPAYMNSVMASSAARTDYNPNVHMPPSQSFPAQTSFHEQQGGVMASIMGMGGGLTGSMMESRSGSVMGSANGSMTSMVAPSENRSPNMTPMGSMKAAEPASNPMASFMSSIGIMPASAASMPAMKPHTAAF
jgi:hypothetical protein